MPISAPQRQLNVLSTRGRLSWRLALMSAPLLLLCLLVTVHLPRSAEAATPPNRLAIQRDLPCPTELLVIDEPSLRSAIDCANHMLTGTLHISITADITYTAPLTALRNAQLSAVTIAGNDHILNAAGHGRTLSAAQLQALTLQQLTLRGGVDEINDGGGLSLLCEDGVVCAWRLDRVTVEQNRAVNGGGVQYRCGYHGDGTLLIVHSHLAANEALDEGGGLFYSSDEESFSCALDIRNTLIAENRALYGGGIRSYSPRITITNSTIRANVAAEDGGGILLRKSDGFIDMLLRGTAIYDNEAGGDGGGINITSPEQTFEIQLVNSTISGNRAPQGRGGGLFLQENRGSLRIDLVNSTVAENRAANGGGIFVYNQDGGDQPSLTLANTLVGHNQGADCAAAANDDPLAPPFSGERLVSSGYNLDSDGSCLTTTVRRPFDQPAVDPRIEPLADNGGPTWTHALQANSSAIDGGDDLICARPPVLRIDQRGSARPRGDHCDIGAFEVVLPYRLSPIYASSSSSGVIGELIFNNEDILRYDSDTGQWSMLFDGSDVGISADIDAFALTADGAILFSIDTTSTLPLVGSVQPADLIQFTPTKLGNETIGSFARYLNGSAVGLDATSNIDALSFNADGRPVISLQAPATFEGFVAQDEDLLVLNDTLTDTTSAGQWALYLDGSDVGLATGRDLGALWIDPDDNKLYLSTTDAYTLTTLTGDADDILACTPVALGLGSACIFQKVWDGDAVGFGNEHIDGLDIGRLPTTYDPSTVAGTGETPEAFDETPIIQEAEAPEEPVQQIYLPLLRQ